MGKSELKTAGFEAIWPVKILTGHDFQGRKTYVEGYRNMVTGELDECGDWNKDPSFAPTGDLSHIKHRGGSDEFWDNMKAHKEETYGRVVLQEPGRTIIRYP